MSIEQFCYDIQIEKGLTKYFLRVKNLEDVDVLLDKIASFVSSNEATPEVLICSIYTSCTMIKIYPASEGNEYNEQHYSFTLTINCWEGNEESNDREVKEAVNILLPFARLVEQQTGVLVKVAHYVWDDVEGLYLEYDKQSKYA